MYATVYTHTSYVTTKPFIEEKKKSFGFFFLTVSLWKVQESASDYGFLYSKKKAVSSYTCLVYAKGTFLWIRILTYLKGPILSSLNRAYFYRQV